MKFLIVSLIISCLAIGLIESAFDFEQLVKYNFVNLHNGVPFLTGEERFNIDAFKNNENMIKELDFEYDFGLPEHERDYRSTSPLRSMRKIGNNMDEIRRARIQQRDLYKKYLSLKGKLPEAKNVLDKIHDLDWEVGILNGQNRKIEDNRALYDN